ncbi:MAG TPA: hypothetical protein VH062_19655 [Polyangiaceae bacterium]|nr:hypothetical protein [Polyangiaceae bacterium]
MVERAAAEFFEARVLSVAGESLKVQTTAEGDPLTVALNDAYPLKGASHRFTAGNFAICRSAPAHWEACRVVSPGDGSTDVELNAGERRSLAPGDLLAPGPVTVLDLERHFELYDARQRFANTALAAGHPHRPAGWTPAPHEPVLARRGHDWYLAHAAQLLADGGESVVLEGAGKAEGVPGSYVVPAPPFEHTFARGDFALVHPTTPGLPWERVSVEGIGPDGAVIVGASGERRRIEPRNLVPLQSGH